MNRTFQTWACVLPLLLTLQSHAQPLPVAVQGLRIPLAVAPTSRPMAVAYDPEHARYIVADGGFAAMADESGVIASKSRIHVYDAEGKYVHTAKPGLSNKAIYFNPNQNRLEAITYNVSSEAGFAPNTGVFALHMTQDGRLTDEVTALSGPNPAFGSAATAPSFDPAENVFYAKQERSNKVRIVRLDQRVTVGEITLDLAAAGANTDDISEHYAAFTGIPGEELALLDVDHKAILVFDLKGRFVGKSMLPANLKLRANNHFNGHGYANGMFFVYHEPEGEFGTYYGFWISDQVAQP